jgi:hypothetical protein
MNSQRIFPLMGIVGIAYVSIYLLEKDAQWGIALLDIPIGTIEVTYGDLFVPAGLLVLLFELIQSTNTSNIGIVKRMLSVIVLIGYLIALVKIPGLYKEKIFWDLALMSFVELCAGISIGTIASRRDINIR